MALRFVGLLISCLLASQYATAAVNFSITRQPISVTAAAGTTIQFSVGHSGDGTFTYVWYKDGVALSNSNTRWLTITNFSSSHQGQYKVLIKNTSGSLYSNSATAKLSSTTTTSTTTYTSGQGTATVTWTAPVKRTDGDSLTSREIKAYRIYHTVDQTAYKKVYEVAATSTSLNIYQLGKGLHNFALTTVDTANVESKLSPIASKRIY